MKIQKETFEIFREKGIFFAGNIRIRIGVACKIRGNTQNNDLSHQNRKAVCVSSELRQCMCEGQKPKYKQNRQQSNSLVVSRTFDGACDSDPALCILI